MGVLMAVGTTLAETTGGGFSFSADMFSSIGETFASAPGIVVQLGAPIMAVSIVLVWIFSKTRRVAK